MLFIWQIVLYYSKYIQKDLCEGVICKKEGYHKMEQYEKTGYLYQNYKLFYLCNREMQDFDYHYHDFHKILWHIKGNVTYCIEGKAYELKPNDLVLVTKGEVHRPIIHDTSPYERMILYISPAFLEKNNDEEDILDLCFQQSALEKNHVLRMSSTNEANSQLNKKIYSAFKELQNATNHPDFGNSLYCNSLFFEIMVLLNRCVLHHTMSFSEYTTGNKKILAVLDYLNSHLEEEINIDSLANKFFTSRYYLMHSFKQETGYTIGQYLTTKRLLYANELINKGMPITEACLTCGFQNYSSFSRAYKKNFGVSPTKLRESNYFGIIDEAH